MGKTVGTRKVSSLVATGSIVALVLAFPAVVNAYPRPGTTTLIADSALAVVGGSDLGRPDLSSDGRFVAYVRRTDGALKAPEVFRYNRRTGESQLVSQSSSGAPALGLCVVPPTLGPPHVGSESPAINRDGRYIVFASCASNLVPGDTNTSWDFFLRDMRKGTTTRVSVSSQGEQQSSTDYNYTDANHRGDVSADGRFIVFASDAPNLVADDTNGAWDIFFHDTRTSDTTRISTGPRGEDGEPPVEGQIPPDSDAPHISATGRYVVFESDARNFVENDTNRGGDVFVRDMKTDKMERVSVASGGIEVCCTGWQENAIDDSGRYVAFVSDSRDLVPNDTHSGSMAGGVCIFCVADVFVHDRVTRRTERVSVTSWGGEASVGSGWGGLDISPDGRFVGFDSSTRDLAEGQTGTPGNGADVFVHDRETGALDWINVAPDGSQGRCPPLEGGRSFYPSLDRGALHVAFISSDCNLADGAEAPGDKTFIRDRGPQLGFGGSTTADSGGGPDAVEALCFSGQKCLAPNTVLSSSDEVDDIDDVLSALGANIYSASFAYRPSYDDVLIGIELEYMPPVVAGVSPVSYGVRFNVGRRKYEVRATSLAFGTFGLFDCTSRSLSCTKVADLRGGYGTTGMRVLFSLPLDKIGLENGGKLSDVEAYSGLGSYLSGATKVLDQVRFR